MRIRVYSVKENFGIGELNEKYIDILEKYKLEKYVEIDTRKFKFTGIMEKIFYYYITLEKVEDLFEISKKLNENLIIDYNDNSITIYDGYVE